MRLCFCAIGSTRAARRRLDGDVRGFPTCTRSYLGFLFRCCDENAVLGMTHSLSATSPTDARQAGSRVRGLAPGPRVLRPWHTAPTPGGPDVGCGPRPRALGRPSGASAQAVPLIQSVIGLNVLGASQRFL